MSACRLGVSLGNLALTPEKVPGFLIPSACRTPLRLRSPGAGRDSPDRRRLLSDDSAGSADGPGSPAHPAALRLRVPTPGLRDRRRRRGAAVNPEVDVDPSTRAAMSLPHVGKVTTPYGFRAVLAASPCTRRRESLFHQKKVTVEVMDTDGTDADERGPAGGPVDPAAGPPGGSRRLGPVKALRLQLVKELKRPLRALSPARRTQPH
ncbi:C2 calcium-dependent domain-containing protein 4C-like [Myripristis murdjan]|uniref:C2 calcium-dependent domain-containing protein 4C-like n=1 Tax=Myripristis murdjan TaxID=586833 RepID=UPI0011760871|nr:C2 calcium-dependent domain-containing protein 4C-like [Myripristis murdjan]